MFNLSRNLNMPKVEEDKVVTAEEANVTTEETQVEAVEREDLAEENAVNIDDLEIGEESFSSFINGLKLSAKGLSHQITVIREAKLNKKIEQSEEKYKKAIVQDILGYYKVCKSWITKGNFDIKIDTALKEDLSKEQLKIHEKEKTLVADFEKLKSEHYSKEELLKMDIDDLQSLAKEYLKRILHLSKKYETFDIEYDRIRKKANLNKKIVKYADRFNKASDSAGIRKYTDEQIKDFASESNNSYNEDYYDIVFNDDIVECSLESLIETGILNEEDSDDFLISIEGYVLGKLERDIRVFHAAINHIKMSKNVVKKIEAEDKYYQDYNKLIERQCKILNTSKKALETHLNTLNKTKDMIKEEIDFKKYLENNIQAITTLLDNRPVMNSKMDIAEMELKCKDFSNDLSKITKAGLNNHTFDQMQQAIKQAKLKTKRDNLHEKGEKKMAEYNKLADEIKGSAKESATTSDIDHVIFEDNTLKFELYEGFAIESLFLDDLFEDEDLDNATESLEFDIAEEGKIADFFSAFFKTLKERNNNDERLSTGKHSFAFSNKDLNKVRNNIQKFDSVSAIEKFMEDFDDFSKKILRVISDMKDSCEEFKKARDAYDTSKKEDSDNKKFQTAVNKFKREMNSAQKKIKIPIFIASNKKSILSATANSFSGNKVLSYEINSNTLNAFTSWVLEVDKLLKERHEELVKEKEDRKNATPVKISLAKESLEENESEENNDMNSGIPTYESYIMNCMSVASEAKGDSDKSPSKKPLTKKEYLIAMTSEKVKNDPELKKLIVSGKMTREELVNMDIIKEPDDVADKKNTEEKATESIEATPAEEGIDPTVAFLGVYCGSVFGLLGIAAAVGTHKIKKKSKKAYQEITSDLKTMLTNIDAGIAEAEDYKEKNKSDKDAEKLADKIIKAYTSYRVFIASQLETLDTIKEMKKKEESTAEKYQDYLAIANEVVNKSKKFMSDNAANIKELAKKTGVEDVDKYLKDMIKSSKYAREYKRNNILVANESVAAEAKDNSDYNWKSNFNDGVKKVTEMIKAAQKSDNANEKEDSLNHASREVGELKDKIANLDLETYKNIPGIKGDTEADLAEYKETKKSLIEKLEKEIDNMNNVATESYTKEEVTEFLKSFGLDENGNDIATESATTEEVAEESVKTSIASLKARIIELNTAIREVGQKNSTIIGKDLKADAKETVKLGKEAIKTKEPGLIDKFKAKASQVLNDIKNLKSDKEDSKATESLSDEDNEALALLDEIDAFFGDDVATEGTEETVEENEEATESAAEEEAAYKSAIDELEEALLS